MIPPPNGPAPNRASYTPTSRPAIMLNIFENLDFRRKKTDQPIGTIVFHSKYKPGTAQKIQLFAGHIW